MACFRPSCASETTSRDAAQAALDEAAQERRPERPIFRRADVHGQHLTFARGRAPIATTVVWLVTRPSKRTLC